MGPSDEPGTIFLTVLAVIAIVVVLIGRSQRRSSQSRVNYRARQSSDLRRNAPRPTVVVDNARSESSGEKVDAKVMRVIDGDTVDVKMNGRMVRIRLAAIDCPEDGQPWGLNAKKGLIKMIGGKPITVEPLTIDVHGRTVATLYVNGSDGQMTNVCERIVMLGHAWVMRRFYTDLPKERQDQLNRLERWAKGKRVGLWKTGNTVPPWKWRKGDE